MNFIEVGSVSKEDEFVEFNGYATYEGQVVDHVLISEVMKSKTSICDFARNLNGVYSLVYKKSMSDSLYVFTDRLGISPFYIATLPNGIMLARKVSAFRGFDCLTIDKDAILEYIRTGHYVENKTMFSEVKRCYPATIYECDIESKTVLKETSYWSWREIKKKPVRFEEAVDRVYELFTESVARCISQLSDSDSLSIMLSGGLDSRVIYAESRKQHKKPIATYTFGKKGCSDFGCIDKLSSKFDIDTNYVYIDSHNWQDGRDDCILSSDGMFNYYHMHAACIIEKMSNKSTHVMNGFIGDVIMGGSYLNNTLNENVDIEYVHDKFGDCNKYNFLEDDFFSFECVDPYQIYLRGTRFVASGSEILEEKIINLKPFVDYELMDFIYSLPDEFRYRSSLYSVMLRKYYPEYFDSVEWVNTGKVVSNSRLKYPKAKSFVLKKISPLKSRIKKILSKSKGESYQGYSQWMRNGDFVDKVERLVDKGISFNGVWIFTSDELRSTLSSYSDSKYLEMLGCIYTTERFLNYCEAN